MIANMNIRSMSKTPSEPIAGVAYSRVLNISCNFCCFLISLRTRQILSVLIIAPSISKSIPAQPIIRITRVENTTKKSNLFQLSLKYSFHYAIIFRAASIVNISMKMQFAISMGLSYNSGYMYHLNARVKVLPTMHHMMNQSNPLDSVVLIISSRQGIAAYSLMFGFGSEPITMS